MAVRYEHHTGIKKNKLCPFIFNWQDSAYSAPSNWHSNIEIILITGGTGAIQYGKESLPLESDDIVIVNSGVIHRLYSKAGMGYNFIIIDESFCMENGIDTSLIHFTERFRDEVTRSAFMNVAGQMKEYSASPDPINTAKLRSAVLSLLIDIASRHSSPAEINSDAASPSEVYVKRTIEYINGNYAGRITLDAIALLCGITKFHLAREFKRMTGQTIVAYINTLRCKHAQMMIGEGKTVTEAMIESGFESLSYFSRTYKKLMGASPSKNK